MKKQKPSWITRREFLKGGAAGVGLSLLSPFARLSFAASPPSDLFWVRNIPRYPFILGGSGNYHAGLEGLLQLMGSKGLKFYRSSGETPLAGPTGLIEPEDVVLIKVNAQWKYRGCTNSDLIRGLIQRVLAHPEGFSGEVVIVENGQGRGSLNCDTSSSYGGDTSVRANAINESHSFIYLINSIFSDPRVSGFLLDPIRGSFIDANNHTANGYRTYENVSYPCFTTAGGRRVELKDGLWTGSAYSQKLKLINVPVLKHHDTGGSEITESLKHFYGLVSMSDGQSNFRHYSGLGETCGKMVVSVRTPVLNIIDAIWVSHLSLNGYPASNTYQADELIASQDPVALDYWAAKYVLYPINNDSRHHPDFAGINAWLTGARDIINIRGGLYNPSAGIAVSQVTKTEADMRAYLCAAPGYYVLGKKNYNGGVASPLAVWRQATGVWYVKDGATAQWGQEGDIPVPGDYNSDGVAEIAVWRPATGVWHIKDGFSYKWGDAGDVPVPARYVVGGSTNIAVWRPSNGTWYIKDIGDFPWGTAGDYPVPGDYNGDGKDELAVWRPANGTWYVNGVGVYQWGQRGDIPVPADYDGDGKTDRAVFRPATGVWYIQNSNGGTTITSFGKPGDIPAPGDYNGDGRAEIAVWRPSEGMWYIMNVGSYQWGAAGDIPLVR